MNKFVCQLLSIVIVANASGQFALAEPANSAPLVTTGMTIAELQQKYPDATIKAVSPENFEREVA